MFRVTAPSLSGYRTVLSGLLRDHLLAQIPGVFRLGDRAAFVAEQQPALPAVLGTMQCHVLQHVVDPLLEALTGGVAIVEARAQRPFRDAIEDVGDVRVGAAAECGDLLDAVGRRSSCDPLKRSAGKCH